MTMHENSVLLSIVGKLPCNMNLEAFEGSCFTQELVKHVEGSKVETKTVLQQFGLFTR